MNPNNTEPYEPDDVTSDLGATGTSDWDSSSSPPSPAAPPPLRSLGVYEILGEMARGGMGVVYKARQRGLDRVVALKMILGSDPRNPAAVDRFLQEAKTAASLDHPNVVPVYDAGEVDGRLYFTMAFVNGPDLQRFVEDGGVPQLAVAIRLFVAITAGVAHAHRHGIVHRDLKPPNVMIDQDGRPRVTDFGLAKWLSRESQLTNAGQVMGTAAYMAPEQALESKDVDASADVYALGGVLYFLLTGRAPFGTGSVAGVLAKVLTEPPTPPRQFVPTLPAEVEAVCLRCLAKAPGDRYADAQVLLEAFTPIADRFAPRSSEFEFLSPQLPQVETSTGESPHATETRTVPIDSADQLRPRRWSWTALGAGAALLSCVLGLALGRPREQTPAPTSRPPAQPPAVSAISPPPSRPPAESAISPPPSRPPVESEWVIPATGNVGLSVQMITAAERDDAGILRIPPGVGRMRLRVRANTACALAVFNVAADGVITRLFPNDQDADDRLAAGQDRLIPPDDRYTLDSVPTIGAGSERLHVVATTGELARLPEGQRVGPFVQYSDDADRRQVEETLRGFTVGAGKSGKSGSRTAEAGIGFRVTPH